MAHQGEAGGGEGPRRVTRALKSRIFGVGLPSGSPDVRLRQIEESPKTPTRAFDRVEPAATTQATSDAAPSTRPRLAGIVVALVIAEVCLWRHLIQLHAQSAAAETVLLRGGAITLAALALPTAIAFCLGVRLRDPRRAIRASVAVSAAVWLGLRLTAGWLSAPDSLREFFDAGPGFDAALWIFGCGALAALVGTSLHGKTRRTGPTGS